MAAAIYRGMQHIKRLLSSTRGLSTVEYIILLMALILPAIAIWKELHCEIETRVLQATWDVEEM